MTTKKITKLSLIFGFCSIHIALLIVLSTWVSKPASAEETLFPNKIAWSDSSDPVANCRYGVSIDKNADQLDWVTTLGAGWFLDFAFESPAPANGAEYAGIVYVRQDKDGNGNYLPTFTVNPALNEYSLGPVIKRNPGRIWFVGNEVDRGPNPGEIVGGVGDTYPDVYAQIYHDVYYFIKSQDPTALVANSALIQMTPNRLQYLDMVWNSYRARYGQDMPVDVWNMHLYILPELTLEGEPNNVANIALGTDPQLGIKPSDSTPTLCPLDDVYCYAEHDNIDTFASQVIAMRQWMRDHGQQDKPLIISEYSVLWPYYHNGQACGFKDEYGNCFDPPRIARFVANSFDYLLNTAIDPDLGYEIDDYRLVQQWLWFGIHYKGLGHTSNLITGETPPQLTEAGLEFQSIAMNDPVTVNLIPGKVEDLFHGANAPNGTADVELIVPVHNNANHGLKTNFNVTFYSDEALTEVIGTSSIEGPSEDPIGLQGCGIHFMQASVTWSNLPVGSHQYWAKIDPLNQIGESNEADNIISGKVLVLPPQVYFPTVSLK